MELLSYQWDYKLDKLSISSYLEPSNSCHAVLLAWVQSEQHAKITDMAGYYYLSDLVKEYHGLFRQ